MADDVVGLRVIVCGAAGGIGAACVEGLHADGAEVVALYNRSDPPAHLADKARWLRCDLTDKRAVDAQFDEAARILGGLDALIQAAGTWRGAPAEAVSENEIDFLFTANVKSTVFSNQAAYRLMQGEGGRIINFGSSEGVSGNVKSPVYSATRGAVHSWTRSVARAWGKHHINVNAIAPAMYTDLAEYNLSQMDPESRAAFEAALEQRIPIDGRLGEPLRDLYPVLRMLIGPGGRFVTGQLIPVDGGLIMVGA
jgi:NAD(P)-dependent dehydrogenase (short-subunit alcohol dehydrogenase family)